MSRRLCAVRLTNATYLDLWLETAAQHRINHFSNCFKIKMHPLKKKEQNLPAEEDRHDAQRVNPPMHRLKFSHRKIFSPSIRPNKSLAWKKQQTKGIKRPILQAISATAGPFFSLPAWVSRHSLQSRKQCPRQFQWIISPANKEGEQELTKRFPIVSQLKQITSAGYNTNASYLSIPENL